MKRVFALLTAVLFVSSLGVLTAWADQHTGGELNHFRCYRVTGATKVNAPVTLSDQFLTGSQTTAKKPKLLCVPVDKNGEGFANTSTPDHLLCYKVLGNLKANFVVQTSDQFGPQTLNVINQKLLCVPAFKTPIGPIPTD